MNKKGLNGTSSTSKNSNQLKGSSYMPPPYPEFRNRTVNTDEDLIDQESSEVTSRFVPNSAREARDTIHQDRLPEHYPRFDEN